MGECYRIYGHDRNILPDPEATVELEELAGANDSRPFRERVSNNLRQTARCSYSTGSQGSWGGEGAIFALIPGRKFSPVPASDFVARLARDVCEWST
jgi:hypothetical protein